MTEEDLIKHCKEKNSLAQRILFERYYQQTFHLAYRYLANHHDVEDVLSQVFTRLFGNISSFEDRGIGSFNKWVNTIVINESIRFLSRKKLVFYPEEISDFMEDRDSYFDPSIDIEKIFKAINELTDTHRLVFNLFVMDEYSHKEIAEKLNISINTSKSHLHRTKIQLRNKLNVLKDHEKFR